MLLLQQHFLQFNLGQSFAALTELMNTLTLILLKNKAAAHDVYESSVFQARKLVTCTALLPTVCGTDYCECYVVVFVTIVTGATGPCCCWKFGVRKCPGISRLLKDCSSSKQA